MRAAVRGPEVPQNTIKPCVDIVHFLITTELWNRTPANRGTWCAANGYEPTHLDKQPTERWLCKCQALRTDPQWVAQKSLSCCGDHSHFSPLGIQLYLSLRSSSTNRDKQWIPFFGTQGTYTKKGLSAGMCSVQMTAYHISSLPSGRRQRDRGTISKIKMLGDWTWTGWLSKSEVVLKKYTKFCTLFIRITISWVRHCAKGCCRKKKKTEKKSTTNKLPACWYLFSRHEVIWAGWIPVESILYSQY